MGSMRDYLLTCARTCGERAGNYAKSRDSFYSLDVYVEDARKYAGRAAHYYNMAMSEGIPLEELHDPLAG